MLPITLPRGPPIVHVIPESPKQRCWCDGSFRRGVDWTVVNEARRRADQERKRREPFEQPSTNGPADVDLATRALIAALPERQRLAVFLRYYAGLDYRAIAEVMEIEIGTVSATLASAHQSLRSAIEGAVR